MIRQQGYALLFGVFMLLGLGGLWFGGTALQMQRSAKIETLALVRAKSALIHYAASYIDHYGAQGAGLGHLPCPDTDAPSTGSSDPWRLDGPNPPCAHGDIQTGWLPRHVSVNHGRYHFHTRDRQRLLYAVSGNYVNNPLGRPVNPETSGLIRVGQLEDVVAVLVSPSLETEQNSIPLWLKQNRFESKGAAYVVIRSAEIRTVVMQRAAQWLLRKLNQSLTERCLLPSDQIDCLSWVNKIDQCELSLEHQFMYWLYSGNLDQNCLALENGLNEAFAEFESVPFKRHWFIRNHWHRYLEFTVDAACINVSVSNCTVQLRSIATGRLAFALQPMDDSRVGPEVISESTGS